jgi:Electron transfer DM13
VVYFLHMKPYKKILLGVGAVLGLGAAWYLGSPLFITKRVSEALPSASDQPIVSTGSSTTAFPVSPSTSPSVVTISQGTFTGFDKLHQASGTARIIQIDGKRYLRFEDDFKSTNGPDLFVHLGKNDAYDANARLGVLKGNEGSQNYEIPENLNIDEYSEVWIWCRAFSVPFGKAVFDKPTV